MTTDRTEPTKNAFTLIELMVVVAIIALLVGILLPVFGSIRTQARYTQATAQFAALDTGLNMFRAETVLGGTFPPSASDHPTDRQLIANPKGAQGDHVRIAGAHLLVHAMVGTDGLGTPGLRDFDGDGQWWNDTYSQPVGSDGAYSLDAAGREVHTRYGGAGYVDDKMKQQAKSLADLQDKGVVQNLDSAAGDVARDEPVFVSPWDTPILYYKASTASFRMIRSPTDSGIYTQEDNGIITASGTTPVGLDFGAGKVGSTEASARYHAISVVISPDPTTPIATILTDPAYDDSLARFIVDRSVLARREPVKKDSYLLISAGPDARYGTSDDATNWTREQD